MSDAGLAHFKDCKNLTSLWLCGYPGERCGAGPLQDCKNLTSLDLDATQVSDAGLVHFKDCKNLEHLNLGSTQVSDVGLAYFKDCKNLKVLGPWQSPGERCGADHTSRIARTSRPLIWAVTESAMRGWPTFKDCKKLSELDSERYLPKVSDAGLAYFKDCRNLTKLNLLATAGERCGLAHFKDCENLAWLNLSVTSGERCGTGPFQGLQEPHMRFICSTQVS